MLGIAFGGGGARGAAHIGVLKHLHSIDLVPQVYAGTSAGSIIACLAAFGVSTEDMQNEIAQLKSAQFTSLRIGALGLLENDSLRSMLEKLIGKEAQFKDAKYPLAIHVTDCESGRGTVITQGPVIEAVLASCCVPGVYIPQEINSRLYIDGGLTENVPITALKLLGARTKIGVNLNGNFINKKPDSISDVIMTAMDIAIDHQTFHQLRKFDSVISMDLHDYSRTNAKDTDQLVQVGQKTAQETIPNKRKLIIQSYIRLFFRALKWLVPYKIARDIDATHMMR